MGEAQPEGVQELPLEAEIARDAVLCVACDGEVDRRQMDANLVRPPGFEAHVEECVLGKELDELEEGHRFPGLVRVERAARRIPAIAPDGRVDAARPRLRPPADKRSIATLDLA